MKILNLLFAAMALATLVGCSQVPPGYVGVKVYLMGGSKGVDHEVLPVGRYWIGVNEQLYTFPTFQQNYVWTASPNEGEGANSNDESIEFGAKGGVDVHANVGVSFHVNKEHIADVFQKYREGLPEIRNIPLRNAVRDSFQREGGKYTIEELYGKEKAVLMNSVLADVRAEFAPLGIVVDSLSIVGNFKLPAQVTEALNSKIKATQQAEQRQNEVAEAIAQANKDREQARGVADANRIKASSITPALIEWERSQRWDGKLPLYQGQGGSFMLNLGNATK